MYSKASYELSVIRSTLVYWPASNKNIFMFDLCSPLWCAFLFMTLSWHSFSLRLSVRENRRILLQHFCVWFLLGEFPSNDWAIGTVFMVSFDTGTTKRASILILRTRFQDSFIYFITSIYNVLKTLKTCSGGQDRWAFIVPWVPL